MHPIIRITLETVAIFIVLGLLIYGAFYYVFTKMFEVQPPTMKCPVKESLREDNYEVNYLTDAINRKLHEHGITRPVLAKEVSCYWSERALRYSDNTIVVESKEIHDIFQNIKDKYFSQEETDINYFDGETSEIFIRYDREIFIDRKECEEDCDSAFRISNFRKIYAGLDKLTVFYSMGRESIHNYFFYIYLSVDYEKPVIIFSWSR